MALLNWIMIQLWVFITISCLNWGPQELQETYKKGASGMVYIDGQPNRQNCEDFLYLCKGNLTHTCIQYIMIQTLTHCLSHIHTHTHTHTHPPHTHPHTPHTHTHTHTHTHPTPTALPAAFSLFLYQLLKIFVFILLILEQHGVYTTAVAEHMARQLKDRLNISQSEQVSCFVLKGTIRNHPFQTLLFPNPQIFLHIQREVHCNNLQQFSWKQHIVAFRLACCLLHCCFDGDFCTTTQAPLAAEGRPRGKRHLANKSITPLLCPQRQTQTVEFYSIWERCRSMIKPKRHGH